MTVFIKSEVSVFPIAKTQSMNDYITFLHKKLYIIEMMARKRVKEDDWKQVLDTCMASPAKIEEIYSHLSDFH